ncbi:MAG: amino acid--tRNA ligase-related protein, partial [Gemmatimonadales bacterium]
AVVEAVLVALWDEAGETVRAPFPRMSFAAAMERYGTDKPDLRFGYVIEDLSDFVRGRGFQAFDAALSEGGRVRGIRVAEGAKLSRKAIDALTEDAKKAGAGGLAILKRKGDELSGPLARLDGMTVETSGLQNGDLLLATAGPDSVTSPALDRVRLGLIILLEAAPREAHAFTWIEEFPLFERNAEGTLAPAHHPFTAPHGDDVSRFEQGDLDGVRALHYDAVYNGTELGSGSIRISDPELQLRALEACGLSPEEAEERFGFLLRALRGGVPPHGGFALGFDRLVMVLAGAHNLRDVIAFPKTTAARALFEDTPTSVSQDDLLKLHIRTVS